MTPTPNKTRRSVLGLMAGAASMIAMPAQALSTTGATQLIEKASAAVFAAINSGKTGAALYAEFERIFARYADVNAIARSCLGPAARTASSAEFAAYRTAFQGYIARKYGKRFREFIGSRIEVGAARKVKSFYAVSSVAKLNGRAPLTAVWHVSDKSGSTRFFNIIIEGVNMLSTERAEIKALLLRHKGDLGALSAALRKAG